MRETLYYDGMLRGVTKCEPESVSLVFPYYLYIGKYVLCLSLTPRVYASASASDGPKAREQTYNNNKIITILDGGDSHITHQITVNINIPYRSSYVVCDFGIFFSHCEIFMSAPVSLDMVLCRTCV